MLQATRQHDPGIRGAVLLSLLACLLAGCGREAGPSAEVEEGSVVLAIVGGQTVTESEFRRAWQARPQMADTPAGRQRVLDGLIERAALVDAARRAGLERDPEIAVEMERLLIAGLRQKQLQPQLESLWVSEEELQAYYEQHRQERFTQDARVQVAVLWFDTHGQAPMTARFRPRLEAVREQVLANPELFPVEKGFGSVAIANSEHRASRYRGGDLGWLTVGTGGTASGGWNAVVQEIARRLETPGELSGVVDSPEGLFLVRLMARRPGGVADFSSVRDRIESELLRERRQALEADFRSGIMARVVVKRRSDALAGLVGLESTNLASLRSGEEGLKGMPVRP